MRFPPMFLFFLPLFLIAKIHCVASIAPVESFAKAIGGREVTLSLMVPPGQSPHTYEPKPSQMRAIANADCYLAVGVEFEKAWLPRFLSQNPKMIVVDLSRGIKKYPMVSPLEGHAGHPNERGLDPHIWTAPENVKMMGRHIAETFEKLDPAHKELYAKRLQAFLGSVDATDRKIRNILSALPPHSAFMVFHPSWGYFAREYGLRQLPVEIEGKAPKPRQLMQLIDEAKREHVRAIFVQPEFSQKSARLLARELKIPIVSVSPLSSDWEKTLLKLARALSGKKLR